MQQVGGGCYNGWGVLFGNENTIFFPTVDVIARGGQVHGEGGMVISPKLSPFFSRYHSNPLRCISSLKVSPRFRFHCSPGFHPSTCSTTCARCRVLCPPSIQGLSWLHRHPWIFPHFRQPHKLPHIRETEAGAVLWFTSLSPSLLGPISPPMSDFFLTPICMLGSTEVHSGKIRFLSYF